MKGAHKVYPWRDFVAFVNEAQNHDASSGTHSVVDAIARDLLEGHLMRRDESARPIGPWQLPSELPENTYLLPSEVNARPIMKDWLLEWSPAHQLTTAEELAKYGWKGALQLEEKRIREEFRQGGITLRNTTLAEMLLKYAKSNGILTGREEVPAVGTIRNQVISKSKGRNPRAPAIK
jgi:hypothetical protein